jgi:hypothetical protein
MPESDHRARLVPRVTVWFSAVTVRRNFVRSVPALALEGRREPVMGSRGIR